MTRDISIHAARMGCDLSSSDYVPSIDISIHAARMGCDSRIEPDEDLTKAFQSTQPEWAATIFKIQITFLK